MAKKKALSHVLHLVRDWQTAGMPSSDNGIEPDADEVWIVVEWLKKRIRRYSAERQGYGGWPGRVAACWKISLTTKTMDSKTYGQSPSPACSASSEFTMKAKNDTIYRGFGPGTTPQDISRIIGRLVKWTNEFEKFMDRCAPGFKQPHEARIYKHFWLEIDDQIREVAHALGDDRGTVMTYVHTGGCVQLPSGQWINTPWKLVKYLLRFYG